MDRRHRLRRSADIQAVRRFGKRVKHPLAVLYYHRRPADPSVQPDVSRFCVSAGRPVGNAVRRNRAKRLLREAVRRRLNALQPATDCVLVAQAATATADFAAVDAAVLFLLQQARLLPPA